MHRKKSDTWLTRPGFRSKIILGLNIIIYLYSVVELVKMQTSKRNFESISVNTGEFFTNTVKYKYQEYYYLTKYIKNVCKLTRKRRNKLKKAAEGNKRNMTILSQNIPQGTCRERVEAYLDDIVNDLKPEVLFLNEINADTVEESCPDGYRVIKGRLENANKIRLSAIVKKTCNVEELEMDCELPTIKMKVNGWLLVSAYREWRRGSRTECTAKEVLRCLKKSFTMPKDTEDIRLQEERFESFIKKWKNMGDKRKIIVIGDLNINWKESKTQQYKRCLPMKEMISEEIMKMNYCQLINEYTRHPIGRQKQEPSCLDHIYTTRADWTVRTWNEDFIGRDHNLVGVKITTDRAFKSTKTFTTRMIQKACPITFARIFSYTNPGEILVQTNVNNAVRQWENRVLFTLDQIAPLKLVRPRENYNPWMNKNVDLNNKRKEIRYLFKWAKRVDSKESWDEYHSKRNEYYKWCQSEKNEYRKKEFENVENDAEFWSKVNEYSDNVSKEESEIEIEHDGNRVSKPAEVATILNLFFREKVLLLKQKINENVDLALKITRDHLNNTFTDTDRENFMGPQPVAFETVNDKVIMNIISKLKSSGAEGVDGMNTKIIKRFKSTLATYLRHIVNLSIMTSTYPERWKSGIITPLPKGGSRLQKKNWRPIVINCPSSKILEKVLQLQISQHMEFRGIFSKTQHAYRCARSCESALVDLNTQTETARCQGKYVGKLITDMSAAFNLIQRQVLVPKMSLYGFDENSCKLLNDYLTNRQTQCKVKNSYSEFITLPSGVGEGSVLGPTFFACGLVDIDQVAKITESKCVEVGVAANISTIEYADDCTGLVVADTEKDLQVALNIMLQTFQMYFEANSLCLNYSKCQVLVYRPKQKVMDIYIGDKKEENEVKLLGAFQDTEGRYAAHFNHVQKGVMLRVRNLRRVCKYLNVWQRKKACESLILSKINYGLFLYGQVKVNQVKITKLVNTAMRIVLQIRNPILRSVKSMYEELSQLSYKSPSGTLWLNGENLYEYSLIMLFRRITRTRCAPITYEQITSVPKREGLREGDKSVQVGERKFPWTPKARFKNFSDRCVVINCISTLNKRKLNWLLLGEDSMKKIEGQNGTILDSIKLTIKDRIIEHNGNDNFGA